MMKKFLTTTATILSMATIASAQNTGVTTGFGAKTPLFDAIAGKFNLTANVGYVYNFANDWGGGDVVGKANGGLGYGGRIGWTNNSGFGVSADYLGFASKWKNDFEITNNYHVVTFTPSYRISFGSTKEWGLKLGLGVGFSLADVSWIGNKASANSFGSRVAGGASYKSVAAAGVLEPSTVCGVKLGGVGVGVSERVYTDSLGITTVPATLGANRCQAGDGSLADPVRIVDGLSDQEIAAFFTTGTGAPSTTAGAILLIARAGGDPSGPDEIPFVEAVSYGVWRRIFTTGTAPSSGSTAATGSLFRIAATFNAYETRSAYVTRCTQAAADAVEAGVAELCFGNVAGAVVPSVARAAAAVAAACVTNKGPGAISVNGVCKSSAEQATDAAAQLANEECEAMGNGSTYSNGVCSIPPVASKAKDDAGFVLAPEIGLEYDNGVFHADINARYIHELFHVKYDGQNGAADQLQKSGPLAVFIGAGLGVNF